MRAQHFNSVNHRNRTGLWLWIALITIWLYLTATIVMQLWPKDNRNYNLKMISIFSNYSISMYILFWSNQLVIFTSCSKVYERHGTIFTLNRILLSDLCNWMRIWDEQSFFPYQTYTQGTRWRCVLCEVRMRGREGNTGKRAVINTGRERWRERNHSNRYRWSCQNGLGPIGWPVWPDINGGLGYQI